jgi:hypothetical protein
VKNGVLHGIRSTETPQGRITSRIKYMPSLHLYPDPGLMCFKLLFPYFPEPEIYLPAGTDLRVGLKNAAEFPAGLAPVPSLPEPSESEMESTAQMLNQLPARTLDKNQRDADLIDIAFVGSRHQLEEAFRVAGWKSSDTVSRRTVLREFRAYLSQTADSTAPMSPQSLAGRPPDLTLEKTFDSYQKRDHVRIWHVGQTGDEVSIWASAAVQEKGATLSLANRGFIHHVAEDLDEERNVVKRDLAAEDCIASVGVIRRSGGQKILINATGELLRSDGNIPLFHLKDCRATENVGPRNTVPYHPASKFARYLRRQILTVRSDLLRANCIYSAFDLSVITVRAVRQKWAHHSELKLANVSHSAPQPPGEVEAHSTLSPLLPRAGGPEP